MGFRKYTIFIIANEKAKKEIIYDPVLTRNLYHLKNPLKNTLLPECGLYLIDNIMEEGQVECDHQIPWDAIWSKKRYVTQFPDIKEMIKPPKRMLERMVELYEITNSPLFYYCIEMHGGTVMDEYSYIIDEDHYLLRMEEDEPFQFFKNGKSENTKADILQFSLNQIGVKTDTGWFEPFTGAFDWDERSVFTGDYRKKAHCPESLYLSVKNKDIDSVKKCLENGIEPSHFYITNLAAETGDSSILKLITDKGAPINEGNSNPLCDAKDLDCVKILVEKGAHINDTPCPLNGPLKNGSTDGVKYLLEAGTEIKLENNDLFISACEGGLIWFAENFILNSRSILTENPTAGVEVVLYML